jgi:hypothetical protein
VDAISHEFFGQAPMDTKHFSNMFMSYILYNLSLLDQFKCEMQKLIYKIVDSFNIAYLKHYLATTPGYLPNLVQEYMMDHKLHIESQSLDSLHDIIVRTIQSQCI